MQPLDRQLQRRVWDRVYGGMGPPLDKKQRQMLQLCLARCRENLRFFERMQNHTVYAEAFSRLTRDTQEQIKMLQHMLG